MNALLSHPYAPQKARAAVEGDEGDRSRGIVTRSTIWGGGRGCNKFVLVLGGNGTKIAPTGDMFDQPAGQMR